MSASPMLRQTKILCELITQSAKDIFAADRTGRLILLRRNDRLQGDAVGLQPVEPAIGPITEAVLQARFKRGQRGLVTNGMRRPPQIGLLLRDLLIFGGEARKFRKLDILPQPCQRTQLRELFDIAHHFRAFAFCRIFSAKRIAAATGL